MKTAPDVISRSSAPVPRCAGLAKGGGWRRATTVVLVLGAMTFGAAPVRAGWDDFEFGQKLIERGYLDYAKRVFEGIQNNPKSSAAEKDRAKFGMALLGKADLTAAEGNPTTPFATIIQKQKGASDQIEEFISKNGGDEKANDAKMALGQLHLGFVQWCASLIDADEDWRTQREKEKEGGKPAAPADAADTKDVSPLAARGADAVAVRSAAATSVKHAEDVFADLKATGKAADATKTAELRSLAEFNYLTALYYKGLTFEKCKPEAVNAFKDAHKQLEDYAAGNEQYITGLYALDFLGKVAQELADCENDAAKQMTGYQAAVQDYLAAAGAGDQGDEHRKLMSTGFLHIAQLGVHLADRKDDTAYRTLLKSADQELAKLVKQTWLKKYRQGLYGMIAWAEFMARAFDRKGDAIEVLRQASEAAAASSFDDAKRRADSALRRLVTEGGGRGEAVDVSVVIKVADDLYANGRFADAISAYQKVVAGSPKDKESLVKYYLYGWDRIGSCYTQLKLPVEAAAAFDVIADEMRAGRIVPASQEDAVGKKMIDAFNKERAALSEVSTRTGDPAAKKRLEAFTDWQIRAVNSIAAPSGGGSSVGNLALRQALEKFKSALDKRDTAPTSPEWRTLLNDALLYFQQTTGDVKNEFQDLAWVYVVRVPYEMEDWDGVAAAADRAFAYWESPEAKKRAAAEPAVAEGRPGQMAAVAYWKAAALVGAKKDDAAMPILDDFNAKYGKSASKDYLGRAMGLRVEILLRRKDIEKAESAIDELIRENPDYHKLPAIVAQQAEYYRGKESEIQKKIDAVVVQLVGTPANRATGAIQQLKAARAEEQNLTNVISDAIGVIERANLVINSNLAAEGDKQAAKEKKAAAEAKLKEAKPRLELTRAEIKRLEALIADLTGQKAALLKEQVPPLRKAAELYRKLDVMFKQLGAKTAAGQQRRRPENVSALAYRYYKLAKIEDTDADAWETSKVLYEDWLAFPEIKAQPDSDASKRRAFRLLGEVYYRVAAAEKAPDAQRVAYQNAVKYMEDGLGRLASNTPILMGLLAGELVTVPHKDGARTYKIPLAKVADVKALKEYVKGLLTTDTVPKYVRDTDQALYEKAIAAFQRRVDAMPDDELKPAVASLKTGGFDAAFFAEFAEVDLSFILALAHAYQAAGQAADAGKAVNILSLLTSPGSAQKLEDDSGDWWEVKTLGLEIRISAAERALQSGGAAAPEAKTYAKQAASDLQFTKQNYPHVGGVERHEKTLEEWIALQVRLIALAGKLGIPYQAVDLKAEVAPASSEVPPTPEPGAGGPPPSPTMDDAGMDGAAMTGDGADKPAMEGR